MDAKVSCFCYNNIIVQLSKNLTINLYHHSLLSRLYDLFLNICTCNQECENWAYMHKLHMFRNCNFHILCL